MRRNRFSQDGYVVTRLGYQELLGVLMNAKNEGVTHVTVDREENKPVHVIPILEMIQFVGRALAKAEAAGAATEQNDHAKDPMDDALILSFVRVERIKELRRKEPMYIADILLAESMDEMATIHGMVRSLESNHSKQAIIEELASAIKNDAAKLGASVTDDQALAIAEWKGYGTPLASGQLVPAIDIELRKIRFKLGAFLSEPEMQEFAKGGVVGMTDVRQRALAAVNKQPGTTGCLFVAVICLVFPVCWLVLKTFA